MKFTLTFFKAEESAASSLTSNVAEKVEAKMARVLYDWTKEDEDTQMSLVKGEEVIVTSMADTNWWEGKLQDDSAKG